MSNPIGDPFLREEAKKEPKKQKAGKRRLPICKKPERSFRDPKFVEIFGPRKLPRK